MCDDYCAALIHSSQFLICDPSRPSDIADALETGILIFCRIILVVFYVFAPYSKTDLIVIRMSFDAQMFYSMVNAAVALPFLDLTSRLCHPLEVNKGFQFFDGLSTNCDWLFDSGVILFKFHSCWCGCKVKFFHFSCIWLGFWEKRVRSFVKSTLPSCVSSVHCIPLFLPDVVVFIILSVTKRERGLVTVNTLEKFLHWPQNFWTSDQRENPTCIARVCITNRGDELLGNSIVRQFL